MGAWKKRPLIDATVTGRTAAASTRVDAVSSVGPKASAVPGVVHVACAVASRTPAAPAVVEAWATTVSPAAIAAGTPVTATGPAVVDRVTVGAVAAAEPRLVRRRS